MLVILKESLFVSYLKHDLYCAIMGSPVLCYTHIRLSYQNGFLISKKTCPRCVNLLQFTCHSLWYSVCVGCMVGTHRGLDHLAPVDAWLCSCRVNPLYLPGKPFTTQSVSGGLILFVGIPWSIAWFTMTLEVRRYTMDHNAVCGFVYRYYSNMM